MIRTFRYVIHQSIPAYLKLGWMVVADLGPIHGEWSMLLEWKCQCKCVEPV